jgi:aminopeptidase N
LAARLTVVAALAAVAGCQSGARTSPRHSPAPAPTSSATTGTGTSGLGGVDDPALDVAVSSPRRDPVYPQVGNPVVDALHYQLDLTWNAGARRLTGHETLIFRAARDSSRVPLDLSRALRVSSVTLDGQDAGFAQRGQDLLVDESVHAEDRHTLVIDYHGSPRPVAAPTTRTDFSTNGWTVTDTGETWTMQEPYGALTWYAVNDQPADKALYDFHLSVPRSMVGVANGELVADTTSGGYRTTEWHLSSPASSYLVTLAIGDLSGPSTTVDGVPISVWGQSGRPTLSRSVLRSARQGMAFLTSKLGPYPFDSLGFLLVDSFSGMETQTMITLGAPSGYTTSPEVVVHEMAHQWYGDLVTPSTWRDMWMNEGMAMYLQLLWQAEHGEGSVRSQLARYAAYTQKSLTTDGPAADYDPATFGELNVYYVPAQMWDTLHGRLGDAEFWRLVRAWPRSHADGNADYDTITRWWSRRTGLHLRPFFDAWLKTATLPSGRGVSSGDGVRPSESRPTREQHGSPGMA